MIEQLINQAPILAVIITLFLWLRQDIHSQGRMINQRIDDLNESMGARVDDLKENHNNLSAKVDALTAQVNKIEGTLQTILFIMRPPHTGTDG